MVPTLKLAALSGLADADFQDGLGLLDEWNWIDCDRRGLKVQLSEAGWRRLDPILIADTPKTWSLPEGWDWRPGELAVAKSVVKLLALSNPDHLYTHDPSYPRLLVGSNLCPWPGPGEAGGVCPACRGAKLERIAYCLRCDRWGEIPGDQP